MVKSCYLLLSVSVLGIITCSLVGVTSEPDPEGHLVNYIATAELADGEHEVRMRFGDIIVKETSITGDDANKKRGNNNNGGGLLLRQMASGSDFLQMIFKIRKNKRLRRRDKLVECEVLSDWIAADRFRTQFQAELNRSGLAVQVPTYPQQTIRSIVQNDTEEQVDDRESTTTTTVSELNTQTGIESYRNVSLRELHNDEVIGDLQRSFNIILHQRLCKRLHRKEEQRNLKVRSATSTATEENESSKPARPGGFSFSMEFGRMPGTMWCGVGTLADKFSTLGAYVGADRCCRAHDQCPYQIPGFTSKYGLFNYRVHSTVSHCACDERFRSCLKMTNTGAANMVGKVFFNVVQTKCFVLKAEKVCVKTSWWGKCLKYEYKKQGQIRDPVPF